MSDAGEPKRRVSPDCLSDLHLDCLVAGPQTGEEFPASWASHLQTCSDCRVRLEALRQRAAQFMSEFDIAALARRTATAAAAKPKPFRGWLRFAFPAFAVATATAAVLVLALAWPHGPGSDPDGVRIKGAPRVTFMVKRGERVFPGEDGIQLQPRDRLQLYITQPQPSYFLVLGIEPDGTVSTLVPWGAKQAEEIPAGDRVLLQGSLEVEKDPGEQRLVVAICPARFDAQAAQAALSAWDGKPASLAVALERALGQPCRARLVTVIVKEEAP